MAKSSGRTKDEATAPGSSGIIVPALLAVVIGAGGGGAFGYFGPTSTSTTTPGTATSESQAPPASTGRFPSDALEIQIPGIIVQLRGEPKTTVRLDLSIIAAHGTPETGALKSEIREDVIAYLGGLTVTDIEGVRGFQNLREQLDDRAKIRGRGAVLGLLIGGLVLE